MSVSKETHICPFCGGLIRGEIAELADHVDNFCEEYREQLGQLDDDDQGDDE